MSTTIDERIVSMQFDTEDFDKAIKSAVSGLDRLQNSIEGIEKIKVNTESLVDKMTAPFDGITKVVTAPFTAAAKAVAVPLGSIEGAMNSVANRAASMSSSLAAPFRFLVDGISGVAEAAKTIPKAVTGPFEALKETLSSIVKAPVKVSSVIDSAGFSNAFNSIQDSLDNLTGKFRSSSIIWQQVLRNFTDYGMGKVHELGGKLTGVFQMAKSGGMNRAQNIEAAKFTLKGLNVTWDEIVGDLEYAVNNTAYSLDAAASVASRFVSSGIAAGSEDMRNALRAISGAAAMTGSSYTDIGDIFADVAGQGKLGDMQLDRLGMRGLNAAADIARALGTTEEAVRKMVSKGEIEIKQFAKIMNEAYGEHATKANETFSGALSNMKSSINKIGADFAAPYLEHMVPLFNSVRNFLNEVRAIISPLSKIWNVTLKEAITFITGRIDKITESLKNGEGFIGKIKTYIGQLVDAFEKGRLSLAIIVDKVKTVLGLVAPVADKAKAVTGTVGSAVETIADTAKEAVEPISAVVESLSDIAEVAQKVIDGEFGNGDERFKNLIDAGYNYLHIQDKVNEILDHTTTSLNDKTDAELEALGYTREQIKVLREEANVVGGIVSKTKALLGLSESMSVVDKVRAESKLLYDYNQLYMSGKAGSMTARDYLKAHGMDLAEFDSVADKVMAMGDLKYDFSRYGRGMTLEEYAKSVGFDMEEFYRVQDNQTINVFKDFLLDIIHNRGHYDSVTGKYINEAITEDDIDLLMNNGLTNIVDSLAEVRGITSDTLWGLIRSGEYKRDMFLSDKLDAYGYYEDNIDAYAYVFELRALEAADNVKKVASSINETESAAKSATAPISKASDAVASMSKAANKSKESTLALFTEVGRKGKLTREEVDAFAEHGIDVAELIANRLSVSLSEANDMIDAGSVKDTDFFMAMKEEFAPEAEFVADIAYSIDKKFGISAVKAKILGKETGNVADNMTGISDAASSTAMTAAEIESLANRVIAGEFGNGADRFDALTDAGYNYLKVQDKVNNILMGTTWSLNDKTDAELRSMGYSDAQIAILREQAKETYGVVKATQSVADTTAMIVEALDTGPDMTKLFSIEGLRTIVSAFRDTLADLKGAGLSVVDTAKSLGKAIFGGIADTFTVGDVTSPLQTIRQTVVDVAGSIHDYIGDPEHYGTLVNIVKGVASWFSILSRLKFAAFKAFAKVLSFVAENVLPPVLDFLGRIGKVISDINQTFQEADIFTKIIDALGQWLTDSGLIKAAGDFGKNVLGKIGDFAEWAGKQIQTFITWLGKVKSPMDILKGIGDAVKSLFSGIDFLSVFKEIDFGGAVTQIKDAFGALFSGFDLGGMLGGIGDFFSNAWHWFDDHTIYEEAGKFLKGLWEKICDGLTTAWQTISGGVVSVFTFLRDLIFGVEVKADDGETAIESDYTSLAERFDFVKIISDVWNAIVDGFTTAWNTLSSTVGSGISFIWGLIFGEKVWASDEEAEAEKQTFLSSLTTGLPSFSDVVSGLLDFIPNEWLDTISSKVSWLTDGIQGIWTKIHNLIFGEKTWASTTDPETEETEKQSFLASLVSGLPSIEQIKEFFLGFIPDDWETTIDDVVSRVTNALNYVVTKVRTLIFGDEVLASIDEETGDKKTVLERIREFLTGLPSLPEIVASISERIPDNWKEMFDTVREKISGFIEHVSGTIHNLIFGTDVMASTGEEAGDKKTVLERIKDTLTGLPSLSEIVASIAERIPDNWKDLFDTVSTKIREFISLVSTTIHDLIFGTDVMASTGEEAGEQKTILERIKDTLTGLPSLPEIVASIAERIPDDWKELFDTVREKISGFIEYVSETVHDLIFGTENIASTGESTGDQKTILERIQEALAGLPSLPELVATVEERIPDNWKDLFDVVREKISDFIEYVSETVHDLIFGTDVMASTGEEAGEQKTILERIKEFLTGLPSLPEIVATISQRIPDNWKDLFDKASEKIVNFVKYVSDKVHNLIYGSDDFVSTDDIGDQKPILERIRDTLTSLPSLPEIVASISQRIPDNWKDLFDKASKKVVDFVKYVSDKVHDLIFGTDVMASTGEDSIEQKPILERIKEFLTGLPSLPEIVATISQRIPDNWQAVFDIASKKVDDFIAYVVQTLYDLVSGNGVDTETETDSNTAASLTERLLSYLPSVSDIVAGIQAWWNEFTSGIKAELSKYNYNPVTWLIETIFGTEVSADELTPEERAAYFGEAIEDVVEPALTEAAEQLAESPAINDATEAAETSLGTVMSELFTGALETAGEERDRVVKAVKDFIMDKLTIIRDAILEVMDSIGELTEPIIDRLKGYDWETIVNVMSQFLIGTSTSRLLNSFSEGNTRFSKSLSASLGDLGSMFQDFGAGRKEYWTKLGESATTSAEGVKGAFGSLGKAFESVGNGAGGLLSGIAGTIKTFLTGEKGLSNSIGDFLEEIANTTDAALSADDEDEDLEEESIFDRFLAFLKQLTVTVPVMVGSFWILQDALNRFDVDKTEDYKAALMALGGFLLEILGFFAADGLLSAGIAKLGGTMATMTSAIAMVGMVAALWLMLQVFEHFKPIEGYVDKARQIADVMIALVAAFDLSKIGGGLDIAVATGNAIAMVALVAALWLLIKLLENYNVIPWKEYGTRAAQMGAALAALVAALLGTSFSAKLAGGGLSSLSAAVLLFAIIHSLKQMMNLMTKLDELPWQDWEDEDGNKYEGFITKLEKVGIAIGTLLASMAAVEGLGRLGGGMNQLGTALLLFALTNSISKILDVIGSWKHYNLDAYKKKAADIGSLLMQLMGSVLYFTGGTGLLSNILNVNLGFKTVLASALMLFALSKSLLPIFEALRVIGEIEDDEKLDKGIEALSDTLNKIFLVLATALGATALSTMGDSGKGLLGIGNGTLWTLVGFAAILFALAYAVEKIFDAVSNFADLAVDSDKLKRGVDAIKSVFDGILGISLLATLADGMTNLSQFEGAKLNNNSYKAGDAAAGTAAALIGFAVVIGAIGFSVSSIFEAVKNFSTLSDSQLNAGLKAIQETLEGTFKIVLVALGGEAITDISQVLGSKNDKYKGGTAMGTLLSLVGFAAILLALGESVNAMFEAVSSFSDMDPDKMATGLTRLTEVLNQVIAVLGIALVGEMMTDLTAIGEKGTGISWLTSNSTTGTAATLLGMAAILWSLGNSVGAMFAAVNAFSDMDTTKMQTGLDHLTTVLGQIIAVLGVATFAEAITDVTGVIEKSAGSRLNVVTSTMGTGATLLGLAALLLALGNAVSSMFDAVTAFSDMDPDTMQTGLDHLTTVMAQIIAIFGVVTLAEGITDITGTIENVKSPFSVASSTAGTAVTIVGMAALIRAVGVAVMDMFNAVKSFSGMDPDVLETGLNHVTKVLDGIFGISFITTIAVGITDITNAVNVSPLRLSAITGTGVTFAGMAALLWAITYSVNKIFDAITVFSGMDEGVIKAGLDHIDEVFSGIFKVLATAVTGEAVNDLAGIVNPLATAGTATTFLTLAALLAALGYSVGEILRSVVSFASLDADQMAVGLEHIKTILDGIFSVVLTSVIGGGVTSLLGVGGMASMVIASIAGIVATLGYAVEKMYTAVRGLSEMDSGEIEKGMNIMHDMLMNGFGSLLKSLGAFLVDLIDISLSGLPVVGDSIHKGLMGFKQALMDGSYTVGDTVMDKNREKVDRSADELRASVATYVDTVNDAKAILADTSLSDDFAAFEESLGSDTMSGLLDELNMTKAEFMTLLNANKDLVTANLNDLAEDATWTDILDKWLTESSDGYNSLIGTLRAQLGERRQARDPLLDMVSDMERGYGEYSRITDAIAEKVGLVSWSVNRSFKGTVDTAVKMYRNVLGEFVSVTEDEVGDTFEEIDYASIISNLAYGMDMSVNDYVKRLGESGADWQITLGNDLAVYCRKLGEDVPVQVKTGVVSNKQRVVEGGQDIITTLQNKFKQRGVLGTFNSIGRDWRNTILNGINTVSDGFLNRVSEQFAESVKNIFGTDLNLQGRTVGQYMSEGISAGLDAGRTTIWNTIKTIGNGIMDQLRGPREEGGAEVHSPSKVTEEIGRFIGLGLVSGMNETVPEIGSASSTMGDSIVSALRSSIDLAQEVLDYGVDPTIRPVIDLSGAEAGAAQLNRYFGSRTVDLNSSQNSKWLDRSIDLAANAMAGRERNNAYERELRMMPVDNSDMVAAIGQMREDISGLRNAMSDMRVYMDTGALVGSIAGSMDSALGRRAIRRGRGN